jgi:glycosyltransferase involved in cell wall biosynthesis
MERTTLRILYLASLIDVPQDPYGGQGGVRHVLEVASHLHALGHEVKVICGARGRHNGATYVDQFGIEYFRMYRGTIRIPISALNAGSSNKRNPVVARLRRFAGKIVRYVDSIRDRRRVTKFLKTFPADVIYERTTTYTSAGVKVAKSNNIPFIAEVNDLDQSPSTLGIASAIITPEPESLPVDVRLKATKLPWGVSSKFFDIVNSSEHPVEPSESKHPVITLIGSFIEWHGTRTLVETAKILNAELPNARYLLVGDGATRESTEQMVKDAGLESSFEFTGLVDSEEVPKYLAKTDIAVAPYSHLLADNAARSAMAVPMKVLESMAAGVPTVVSEAGNSGGTIEHGVTGWVHETDSPESLATMILDIVQNPDSAAAIAQAGSKKMADRYTWDRHARELESVFNSVSAD